MIKPTKRIHVSSLGELVDRNDPVTGEKVPFSIGYCAESSGVRMDTGDDKCVICVNVNRKRRTHTYKFINSGQIRVVADCLVARVNDIEIIVS